MNSTRNTLALAAAAILIASCESTTEAEFTYRATLTGASERPLPVTSSGSGSFTATITGGTTLSYTITFSDLSNAAVAAHIHGPANSNEAAGVILDFGSIPTSLGSGSLALGATSGTGSGTITLSGNLGTGITGDSLRKLFDAGMAYVNVHSQANPGGEIRGQITRQ